MDYRERITLESGKRSGKPCIRGMRITVYDVLSYLASGMTYQEILDDFPYLTQEDILACLSYAADREHQTLLVQAWSCCSITTSHPNWCSGLQIYSQTQPMCMPLDWTKPTISTSGITPNAMTSSSSPKTATTTNCSHWGAFRPKSFGFVAATAPPTTSKPFCEPTPPISKP